MAVAPQLTLTLTLTLTPTLTLTLALTSVLRGRIPGSEKVVTRNQKIVDEKQASTCVSVRLPVRVRVSCAGTTCYGTVHAGR